MLKSACTISYSPPPTLNTLQSKTEFIIKLEIMAKHDSCDMTKSKYGLAKKKKIKNGFDCLTACSLDCLTSTEQKRFGIRNH